MARIALLPFGSAGDVFPFLWLGRLLRSRGHHVTLITACLFEEASRQAGLEFIPLGQPEDFDKFIANPRIWKLFHGTKLVFQFAGQSIESTLQAIEPLMADPKHRFDLLLAPCTAFAARMLRENHRVPLITVHLQPAVMISAHEMPILFPGMQFFHQLPLHLRQLLLRLPNPVDHYAGPWVAKACASRGIRAPRQLWWDWSHSPDGTLCLFPEWFAAPQPDWPRPRLQWDFPLEDLASEQAMPLALQRFLEQGPAPLVFTAGSANIQAQTFFQRAIHSALQLQRRAVLVTRDLSQLPSDLPPSIHAVSYAPFSTLLPHAAAFIHHGGIGTLSQGFAAGLPQLIVPMAHDQPDNAWRIERLGAGLSLSPNRFSVKRASHAIDRLLSTPHFAQRAKHCQSLTQKRKDTSSLALWIESRLDEST
jgi:rhamnosyltransferase subunit B